MRLGAVAPAAGVETALYAPAAAVTGTIKVFAISRTGVIARVRVVHRPGAGPTVDEDYLTFDEAIPANEGRNSTVFDVENPAEILVRSDVAGVTFQANGIERDT